MKVFIRILSFANNIGRRLGFFFFYAILGIIFGAFNIVLVIPMLSTLFEQNTSAITVPPLTDFSFSEDYLVQTFNHYYLAVIRDYGSLNALLFVCVLIALTIV